MELDNHTEADEEKLPYDQQEVSKAFETIKNAMALDTPEKPGSYAHSWHCNIAVAFYDAVGDELGHDTAHRIGNDAASRFMKLCFDVNTEA